MEKFFVSNWKSGLPTTVAERGILASAVPQAQCTSAVGKRIVQAQFPKRSRQAQCTSAVGKRSVQAQFPKRSVQAQ